MTAKIGADRKPAFLRASARSGNLTLAAEQAGVSKSWVIKARLAEAGSRGTARRRRRPSTGSG